MSARSVSPIVAFRRTNTPPSPLVPSSPTFRMNKMSNIPSIATTSTPPSSPVPSHMSVISMQPPASPILRKKMQLNLASNTLSAPSCPSGISLTVNETRVQPQAKACPVRAGPASPRPAKKVGKRKLGPGCGLLDWIRLCRSGKDLAGNGGKPRPVSLCELAQHNTADDAWTAIRGKVYNMTPYLKFHPGGKEELMKGAGIDCTILFDEVHNWVHVENTLKACYVGPLLENSPTTQRKNSANLIKTARRKDSNTLTVTKTIKISDGVNKPAVTTTPSHLTDEIATRKNSMELRNKTQAADASEEPDGSRQVSPESPIRPMVGESAPRRDISANNEAAESSSMTLHVPPVKHRRSSEPLLRFSWVQSEKAITIHLHSQKKQTQTLKTSDVVLDVNGKSFEAAVFMGNREFVFELKIALAHPVVSSQVTAMCDRIEISLKKEKAHVQWESIGTFLDGHLQMKPKHRRATKYHSSHVESIKTITHDTKTFVLRMPPASYLSVPTGHHLSIKANIDGEEVERSYTPINSLEVNNQRHESPAFPQEPEGKVVELMIKLYNNGKMSRFLSNLKIGDEVMLSDPEGTFDVASQLAPATDILLIAAGSGFTPMVKIMREVASTELVSRQRVTSSSEATGESYEEAPEMAPQACDCDSKVVATASPKTARLLFANKTTGDIMCEKELEQLRHATGQRVTATHVLSNADKSWCGMRGRVSETLIRTNLPAIKQGQPNSALVCICGPEPFTANVTNILVDLDFPDECIHVFQ